MPDLEISPGQGIVAVIKPWSSQSDPIGISGRFMGPHEDERPEGVEQLFRIDCADGAQWYIPLSDILALRPM